jgi:hypothetical protein
MWMTSCHPLWASGVLQGLDGVKDFDYGLYVLEEAAQQLLGPTWGGRAPAEVLGNKAFYR